MKYTLHLRASSVLVLFLLFSVSAFAQLPNFTLTVTPTAQTCLGNGSLSFAVAGNNPGANIDYNVYLLPNTTVPVATVTTSTVSGLVAGSYQVVATQSLNGQSNTSTANVTIGNNVVPLAYTLTPTHVRCGTDGKVTVNVTSGVPVSYQITAGPVTTPLQATNVFNNLPIGVYTIRVYDNCGEAVVISTQLIQLTPGINIGAGVSGVLPITCNTISVNNALNPGANQTIFYPLTAQFTVTPPGGGTPVVITTTITAGNANAVIPFYHNQQYSYNLLITDACGNTYTRNNNTINRKIQLEVEDEYPGCEERIFIFTASTFVGPYTISFPTAPVGFVPASLNVQHPTFSSAVVQYGQIGNPVPEGEYIAVITDACGRTATVSFEIETPDISPVITGDVDCGSTTGTITVIIPTRDIVIATILEAPTAYTGPTNIIPFIDEGEISLPGMPLGDYVFYFTDSCDSIHPHEEFTLAVSGSTAPLAFTQRPGCDVGMGSVRIMISNVQFTQVIISNGPAPYNTPFNASANLAGGIFYMNSLPAGTYTFTITDACGIVRSQQYTINGYNVLQNNFTITPHCGAFDIAMAHTATTGVFNDGYYLQEYNPITGNWGHPSTGVNYPEGTLPTTANSLQLTNNTNLLSLPYTGDFRVLKIFYTWGNGTTVVQRCTSVIYTFTFEGGPQITDAYSFPCAGGLNEVIVVATGISPLTYKITTKNGAPFVIDNGTSNLFSGLESATYNFQVADICGNIRNIQFDINALDPVEIEENGFCEGEDSSLTIEEFSFLTYKWYEASAPNTILSTTGTLNFSAFNSANDAGTYMLQITYSANTGSCLNQLIAYPILPNTLPNAGPDGNASLCNEGAVLDLNDYLTAPFDTGGTWAETTASGAFSGSSFDTAGLAEGIYTFTYTVTGICALDDVATISITLKDIPPAPVVPPVAPVCEGQNVQMFAGIINGATYQWTGPNGFTFAGATPLIAQATPAASGTYSVTMTSGNGCVSLPSTVVVTVNALPQFTLQGSTLLCDGQSTTISVVAGNFTDNQVTYAWYLDAGLLTGLTTSGAEVYDTGTYEVVVTYNGCSASQQIVVAPNTDAFSFELEAGCIDENYIISVVNLTGITEGTYEWTGPMGFSYTGGPEADITNLTPGDYSVTITSAEGCFVTETLPVANTRCSIPRGISPNGDEWNNNFDLSNLEVQHLAIFNRYGMKVYEANSYVDEWHGQSTSGDLPTGAYYYVATLSAGAQRTGWVYLQREIK